jgi:caffeoyl-CoA O-methyltransferase
MGINKLSHPVIFVAFALVCLVTGFEAEAQRRWGASAGSRDETYFVGIEDERVLPMLRHLPRTHGGRNIPAGEGRFLYDIITDRGFTRGLEIGTSNGYSGLWIGLALKQTDGKLVTIEIDPLAANEARKNFRTAGLYDAIKVITADALKAIPDVPGEFDFVFIDASKIQYLDYLALIRHRVKVGGVITAHNINDKSKAILNFIEVILNDEGLETEIITKHNISVSVVKKKKHFP